MIQIYKKSNTDYEKNGNRVLHPESCEAVMNLNDTWELQMEHPIDSSGDFKEVVDGAVLSVPTPMGKKELYRIYKTEKDDDKITASARPIFLDAAHDAYISDIRPTGKNGQDALDIICAGANTKYSGSSDIDVLSTAYYIDTNLIAAISGGDDNSILKRWGGEILYDNFKIIINKRVGGDYGAVARFGHNLTGITEEADTENVITRIYPFGYNGYTLPEGHIDSAKIDKYPIVYAKKVVYENIKLKSDLSGDAAETDIICESMDIYCEELRKAAAADFTSGCDLPDITYTVSMIDLSRTDQYKNFKEFESIGLGDSIKCYNKRLDITTTGRVTSIAYDCIEKKNTTVTVGSLKPDFVKNATTAINKTASVINNKGEVIAERISGILNGMMTQLKLQSTAAKKASVRSLLFEDLDPKSELYGALAIGTQGIEIANTRTTDGKDWDWKTAVTAAGIDSTQITAGTLTVMDSKGNITFLADLKTGVVQINAQSVEIGGKSVEDISSDSADTAVNAFVKNTYTADKNDLQSQIDAKVETWHQAADPAGSWSTDAEKARHVGDLWQDTSSAGGQKKYYYSSAYAWVEEDVPDAVFDAVDGKSTIYTAQPEAYEKNDMWILAADTTVGGTSYKKGSVLFASATRTSFSASDWSEVRYTDDTAVQNLDKNLTQTEIFNRLTDNGATQGIYIKNNKLYINATYIKDGTMSISDTAGKETFYANCNTGEVKINAASLMISGTSVDEKITAAEGDAEKYSDKKLTEYNTDLDQTAVFNKLTNGGTTQGIYLNGGKLYINADYMNSGTIAAARITTLGDITATGTITGGTIQGATIKNNGNTFVVSNDGTTRFGSASGDWLKLNTNGSITGGNNGNTYGTIDFTAATTWNGNTYYGTAIKGDNVWLGASILSTATSKNSGTGRIGVTRSLTYVSNVSANFDDARNYCCSNSAGGSYDFTVNMSVVRGINVSTGTVQFYNGLINTN